MTFFDGRWPTNRSSRGEFEDGRLHLVFASDERDLERLLAGGGAAARR